MKIGCSEISFLIGRGGVSCHHQGWLNVRFMYFFFEIFLEFFSLRKAYKCVCMYLYKSAFSCLICSNYIPERCRTENVIPPSSCNCCEPFTKANTHTHTKHKDDFPTHKKWEGRDLITECILCLPFFFGFASVQSRILPGLHIKSKYVSYVFVQLTHGTNCRNTNTKSSVSQRPRLNLSCKTKCSGLCPVSYSSSSIDILF